MDFTSTPFDYASVDYLYDVVDFYKISSLDLLPFIRHIAKKVNQCICLLVWLIFQRLTKLFVF